MNIKHNFLKISLLLCLIGSATLLHVASYQSFEPLAVHLLFWLLPLAGMKFIIGVKTHYSWVYTAIINICFVTAGIAAIAANHFNDKFQNFSDAAWFYQNSISSELYDATIMAFAFEGYFALSVWRWLYEFFGNLGFSDGRYIGVSFNGLLVAFSGVIINKTCDLIYESDVKKSNRITIYTTLCGIFWLFGSLYLRDAFVLLSISILTYYWMNFFNRSKNLYQIIFLFINSVLFSFVLLFLRSEFVFLPSIFAISAIISIILSYETKTQHKLLLIMMMLPVAIYLYSQLAGSLVDRFNGVSSAYAQHMGTSNQTSSLGLSLIVNQHALIKIILGSGYMLLFPIPFWAGFNIESAYHIFKSVNVLLMYFLLPAYLTGMQKVFVQRSSRKPQFIFLIVVSLGLLFSIVLTSLEGRHLGIFYGLFFLLACLPNLEDGKDKKVFKVYLLLLLSFIFCVHAAWVIIKL